MIDLLHRFFWEDSRVRRTVYGIAAIGGILYASIRTFLFHKPEPQVTMELLLFVSSAVLLGVFVYCLLGRKILKEHAPLIIPRLPMSLRFAGLAACVVLMTAPQVSVSTVQAAIVNQRLEKAAFSLEPDKVGRLSPSSLKSRFQNIASIAGTSLGYKIPANPELVEKLKGNLQQTLESISPDEKDVRRLGASAFVALVAYARANNLPLGFNIPIAYLPHAGNSFVSQVPLTHSIWWQGSAQGDTIVPLPQPTSEPVFPVTKSTVVFNGVNFMDLGLARPFVGTDRESQVEVMNATIEGATQKLDSIVWVNVRFRGSIIIYDGGPLYLGNVSFENCAFKFASDSQGQQALGQIQDAGNNPVTLVSGL